MSRLYHTEEGRVMPGLCEELTRFRRIGKRLDLPETGTSATVYVLARSHPDNTQPLHVSVNGREVAAVEPARPGAYKWYEITVDATELTGGTNRFELRSEAAAMDGWSVALEAGHAEPASELSDDAGVTWRREGMGYLNAVLAEYVLRVRLAEGDDPPPPAMVWEDRRSARLGALRQRLPAGVRSEVPTLERARTLSSWLAGSWEHTGSARASQYCPWDAETALAWGGAQLGHNGKRPIVMCVHYAAALVSAAQAAGIPARCAVLTEAPSGQAGHFVAELWIPEHGKWVVVDPNCDAMFVDAEGPMAMAQIQAAGASIAEHIEFGPGTPFQRTFPHIVEFLRDNLEKGVCFAHRSAWYRSDLITQPRFCPPGHGSLSYCETGLVWEARDRDRGFGMFPSFGDAAYFDAPPAGF
jgi:hypothetical protein